MATLEKPSTLEIEAKLLALKADNANQLREASRKAVSLENKVKELAFI